MTWEELSSGFLDHLEKRGLSRTSLRSARIELRRWQRFVDERGLGPGDLKHQHLEDYRQRLFWSELALATQGASWRRVGQILAWAFRHGLLFQLLPTEPTPRAPLPTLPIPCAKQLQRMLEAVPDDVQGLRDRAILETLYGTGLRQGECRALDLWDFQIPERQLHVRAGKGKRERLVPVGEPLEAALRAYLERSRPRYRPVDHALFVGQGGRRLMAHGYFLLIRRAVDRAPLDGHLTPHLLRHAFARHLLEGGARIEAVSRLLGHVCLASTARYTWCSPQALHREHRRTHPRRRGEPQ